MRSSVGVRLGCVLMLVLLVACTDGSGERRSEERPGEDNVGTLTAVAGGGALLPSDLSTGAEDAGVEPTSTDLDLTYVSDFAVAPDGGLWVFVFAPGDRVREDKALYYLADDHIGSVVSSLDLGVGTGLTVTPDGSVYVPSATWELLRYRNGEFAPTGLSGESEIVRPAGAGDGTVYVTDLVHDRIVALAPDGTTRTAVDAVYAAALAVGPDGTLYYDDGENPSEDEIYPSDADDGSDTEPSIKALTPSGETRLLVDFGDREPTEGAQAAGVDLGLADMAANEDGLYVLSGSELWQVDGDGRLHLLLRRPWQPPPENNTLPEDEEQENGGFRFTELAMHGDEIYVWDEVSGTIYRVEPDE
jgi:hypothetical protein